jgi:hypothetical protein
VRPDVRTWSRWYKFRAPSTTDPCSDGLRRRPRVAPADRLWCSLQFLIRALHGPFRTRCTDGPVRLVIVGTIPPSCRPTGSPRPAPITPAR